MKDSFISIANGIRVADQMAKLADDLIGMDIYMSEEEHYVVTPKGAQYTAQMLVHSAKETLGEPYITPTIISAVRVGLGLPVKGSEGYRANSEADSLIP